jgi:hypothetical protein
MYWIKERETVRRKKEAGHPKPWSSDPVFHNTYFCNVRREDDKVTRFIRQFYSPYFNDPYFIYNIVFSRFINWPPTLERVGYLTSHKPHDIIETLTEISNSGSKVWGGAYIITTHGIPMGKVPYLANLVMRHVDKALDGLNRMARMGTIAPTARALELIDGIGTFLSGQIVADLKNTKGYPLEKAEDWWTFVTPGPGSMRGLHWVKYNQPGEISKGRFENEFSILRSNVNLNWDSDTMGPPICNQDLQNCLCEFDKYMRVKNGTGKSKRSYNGYR